MPLHTDCGEACPKHGVALCRRNKRLTFLGGDVAMSLTSKLIPWTVVSIYLVFFSLACQKPSTVPAAPEAGPLDDLYPGFSEAQKILEVSREISTPELERRLDQHLGMLSEARSELSYRDEALLWGYAGGLENRPDYNWDRFWPTREKILQFLGELRLLHNLRMIPDCDLVWALSSSGINTYSLAKQQCDSYKTYVDLVNPLVLPAIDGDSKIKPIVIKLPSDVRLNRFPTGTDFSWTRTGSIADGMIRLLPHYFNALVGDPYDAFVITNGCSSECVAKWARAKTFTVQLRRCLDAAGQGVNCTGSFASEDIRTYSITLPVNLGIHAESDYHGSTLTWRYPRMSVGLDELIYASGGDTSVSGNMTWSTDPVLPAGLGLLDSPVRNGQNLQVDLSEGARSRLSRI